MEKSINRVNYDKIFDKSKIKLKGEIYCVDFKNSEASGMFNLIKRRFSKKYSIFYLPYDIEHFFMGINIEQDLKKYIKNYDRVNIIKYLKDFKLDESILKKNFLELSKSEISKLKLIGVFFNDYDVYLLEHIDLDLDFKALQVLYKKLRDLKKINKTIFLKTNNSDLFLKISDKVIYNDKDIILYCDIIEYLADDTINKNIFVPDIISFTQIAKKNNIKIAYRKEVNDLLKDIYKNVK